MRLAAWMPATRATASTSPFVIAPRAISEVVSGCITTRPRAIARRWLASFGVTSTIRARPRGSRCVRPRPDMDAAYDVVARRPRSGHGQATSTAAPVEPSTTTRSPRSASRVTTTGSELGELDARLGRIGRDGAGEDGHGDVGVGLLHFDLVDAVALQHAVVEAHRACSRRLDRVDRRRVGGVEPRRGRDDRDVRDAALTGNGRGHRV